MKIRIMGTLDECEAAQKYYRLLENFENIKYVSLSPLYPNRGSTTLFRLYVDIEYKELNGDSQQSEASGNASLKFNH